MPDEKNKPNYVLLLLVLIVLLAPFFLKDLNVPLELLQAISFVKQHQTIFIFTLILAKGASIVYPPLPGSILTIGLIPVFGWKIAYVIDIGGSMIGMSTSYFLGRKFGIKLLNKVVGSKIVNKITSIKLKDRNQFEAAIMFRLASGGMLSDGLAWGGSLLGFKFVPFFFGYIVSHLITTLPVFFILSLSSQVKSWIIFIPIVIIAWLLIIKFKGRYFE